MAAPSAPAVSLGINGFGRIGRLVLRAALQSSGITPVAINDPLLDAHQALYLFTHDSVHGRFQGSGACSARGRSSQTQGRARVVALRTAPEHAASTR